MVDPLLCAGQPRLEPRCVFSEIVEQASQACGAAYA